MNTDELSQILSDDISNAPEEQRMVIFLLFGIKYAKYLEEGKLQEVLGRASKENAVINFSNDRQVEHGVDLAEFVRLR